MDPTGRLTSGGWGFGLSVDLKDYGQASVTLLCTIVLIGVMDQPNIDARFLEATYVFNLLDLAATAVFAVAAAAAAVKACASMEFGVRRDLIIVGSAFLTGNGGGTARDLLSMQPVFWTEAFVYAAMSLAIGYFAAKFSLRCRRTMKRVLEVLDNFSAGIFTASGVLMASKMLPPDATGFLFLACCMGSVTAVGGGVIRDLVLLRRTPVAFTTPYGFAALIGSLCQGLTLVVLVPGQDTDIGFIWLIGTLATFIVNEAARTAAPDTIIRNNTQKDF